MPADRDHVEAMLKRAQKAFYEKVKGAAQSTTVDISLDTGRVLRNVDDVEGPMTDGLIEVSFEDENRGGRRRIAIFHCSSISCISFEEPESEED